MKTYLFLLLLPLLAVGCGDNNTVDIDPINLFSIQLNGAQLIDGAQDLPVTAQIRLRFSRALNPTSFEQAFSLTSNSNSPLPTFGYANQSSEAVVSVNLDFGTSYTLRVLAAPIAADGGRLAEELVITFTTTEDGTITSQPACTSASSNCLQTVQFAVANGQNFKFYASFPIYEETARWENISAAIIVIHGVNRNGDDYFNYLMDVLQAADLEDNVLVISPVFKNSSEAATNELFWSGTGWRDGRDAASGSAASSFGLIDQLITRLGDQEHFPVLDKIMLTGHSSGALFTHLYAGANDVENELPAISFDYVVANSQYFYFPTDQRVNNTTDQLYTPTNCGGYNIWPLGYSVVPPYLTNTSSTSFNEQFLARDITYLLGNGNQADPTLNTTDCSATLLGPTRFARGENMFRYLELTYPGQLVHKKVIVSGVGHNGQGMYSSPEFRQLLNDFVAGG